MSNAFLTIAQAAEQVGVSRQSIWRKCKAGIIPSTKDKRTGSTVIQVVDLIAHYGELGQAATVNIATTGTPRRNQQQALNNTATPLQQELERLRNELEEKKLELAELKREVREEKSLWVEEKNWFKQLIERQSLLLANNQPAPQPLQTQHVDQVAQPKTKKSKKQKRDKKTGRFA